MAHTISCQTTTGLEEFALKEVKRIIGKKAVKKEGFVEAKTRDIMDLVKLNYSARVVENVYVKLGEFKFDDLKDLLVRAKKLSYSEFMKKGKTFAVSCDRQGEHAFKSFNVETELGGVIINSVKKDKGWKAKVDLNYPDFSFHAVLRGNNCLLGLNSSSTSLNKRAYRVYHGSQPLRASVANAMLDASKWNAKNFLLDPRCGSGVLIIEAAMKALNIPSGKVRQHNFGFTNWDSFTKEELKEEFLNIDSKISKKKLRLQGMDKFMQNVDGSNRNAKIAGVSKHVKFSRYDIDWLDDKYGKNEVDNMIVNPPSRRAGMDVVTKFYKSMFYQAEYMLKKRLTILTNQTRLVEDLCKEHGLKMKNKTRVDYGQPLSEIVNIDR